MSVGLVVHLDIKPESFDEFVDIVTRHGEFTMAHEPDCETFMIMRPHGDLAKLILVEVYASESALESHWASDHMQAYRERTQGMILDRQRFPATLLGGGR